MTICNSCREEIIWSTITPAAQERLFLSRTLGNILKATDKIPIFFLSFACVHTQEQEFVCVHGCLLTEAYLLKRTPPLTPPLSSLFVIFIHRA